MTTSTPTLAAPPRGYTRLPPSLLDRLLPWVSKAIALAVALTALYLVFMLYTTGQTLWALGALGLFSAGFYVYVFQSSLAARYLFPGLAGMVLFIALPLIYTAQIGFTNYSSAHLLSQERVRSYLLDQFDAVDEQSHRFSVFASGNRYRIALRRDDSAKFDWVSPPIALEEGGGDIQIPMQTVDLSDIDSLPTLPLRELVRHRGALKRLVLN